MEGTRQFQRSTTIDTAPAHVWAVLTDARLLPAWVPAVQEVVACSDAGEQVGAVRTCTVRLGGRSGRMVERCTEFEPMRRIAYVVEEESFGLRRMLADYGFAIGLAAADGAAGGATGGATVVTVDTHYTPRRWFDAVLNRLLLRRRFRGVVDELLAGLRSLAESRAETAAHD